MPFELPDESLQKPDRNEELSTRQTVEDVSIENLTAILKDEIPGLEIKDVCPIEVGEDNTVLEINGEYIFRFPKKGRRSVELFDVENGFLKSIEGKTTAEVPKVEFEGKGFQYMGYRKIKGEILKSMSAELLPAEKEGVAVDTAKFLYELSNAMPADAASALDIKQTSLIEKVEIPDCRERVKTNFPEQDIQDFLLHALDRYEQFLAEPQPPQVLLHGDLKPANLIIDPETKRLAGVIDWSYISTGDIYNQFTNNMIKDIDFGKQVATEYAKMSGVSLSEEKLEVYAVVRKIRDYLKVPSRISAGKDLFREFMKVATFK